MSYEVWKSFRKDSVIYPRGRCNFMLHGDLTQPSNYHQCSFWFQELAIKISAIAGYKSFTAGIDHFIIHIFTLIKKRIMGSKVSDWTGS